MLRQSLQFSKIVRGFFRICFSLQVHSRDRYLTFSHYFLDSVENYAQHLQQFTDGERLIANANAIVRKPPFNVNTLIYLEFVRENGELHLKSLRLQMNKLTGLFKKSGFIELLPESVTTLIHNYIKDVNSKMPEGFYLFWIILNRQVICNFHGLYATKSL